MPSHVHELAAMSSAMSFKSFTVCPFVTPLMTQRLPLLRWLLLRLPARAA
jgi:hypothetical protein